MIDFEVYVTISLDNLSTKSYFTSVEWKFVLSPIIKCEDIGFKTVKVRFIYDKTYFIILSTYYHRFLMHYQRIAKRVTVL